MKLRLECLKYGSPIRNQISSTFKIHYDISKDILEYLIESNFTVTDIAKMLSLSNRTVYRRMSKYGIHSRNFTDIDDESLDGILESLLAQFPRCGEKMVRELLFTKNGIKV
jgi:S-adenosylmethionine synthetase